MRGGMGSDTTRSLRAQLGAALHTCFAFWVALSAVPVLVVSFIAVRITKHFWLKVLSSRYPHLEFVRTDTVRSLLDTHRNQGIINVLLCVKAVRITKHFWLKVLSSRYPHLEFVRTDTVRSLLDTHRNQGIINVLLCVKGPCEPELMKAHLLEHVIDKRAKNEEAAYPRMRAALVSCWGNYAWDAHSPFRLENHFLVSSGVFRGRPVTEANIQEYVSDIVSKYFPTDQPPWQYIVVPCISPDNKYYILVRVHHLLLSGKNSINIGDLLLIEQSTEVERTSISAEGTLISPLSQLFPAPSAIPELCEKIGESCSNTWNEFVSEYDPVESPRALKTSPGAFHCAGLALIVVAGALREVNKRRVAGRATDVASALRLFITALRYECGRREITPGKVLLSPLVTLDPRKWPPRALRVAAGALRLAATSPLRLRDELASLRALRRTGRPLHPATLAWRWSAVAVLAWRAAGEARHAAAAALRAPAQLWHDAVRAEAGSTHALQTASLCGRKVVAWSRSVPRASLERAAAARGAPGSAVALHAAAAAVRAYFAHAALRAPAAVLATARAATQDFLLAYSEGDGRDYKKSQTSGMVCISLPLDASPERAGAVLARACRRQAALAGAWAAQARCGALTRALPSPAARLALNALSRRYALSYAEVAAPAGARRRRTAWGHELDHVLYWRPPQANISMSLTVIQYADTVRLAVMTDARLSPHHAAAAARFPEAIEELLATIDQDQSDPTHGHGSLDQHTPTAGRQTPSIDRSGSPTTPDRQHRAKRTIERTDTSHAHFRPHTFLTPEEIRSRNRRIGEESGASEPSMLTPPRPEVISPPIRRQISHE